MTLLDSVNRVRRKLREDPLSSIVATDLATQTVVDFLNESAGELFGHRVWSFLKRDDGQVWFPGIFTATSAANTPTDAGTQGSLNTGANAWSSAHVTDYTAHGQDGRLRVRITWDADTDHPETSYIVIGLSHLPNFPVYLLNRYRGVHTLNTGFTLYSHEFVLPNTVRQVLSVRHEERPLRLEFVDRDYDVLTAHPRATLSFGDPDIAYVGDTIQGTSTETFVAGETGLGLTVWPPPESECVLNYSYVYRYAELTTATAAWTGVPNEHVRLVESMAFEKCLDSNVEDDPQRAAAERVKNEATLARLIAADQRAVNQRRVTPEIGAGQDAYRGTLPRYQVVLTS